MPTEDVAVIADPISDFCFMFEEQEFKTERSVMTAAGIRGIVPGIGPEVPIVLVLDDATQTTLSETDEVHLEKCRKFKRLPRFRRG